ncbi:calcium-dependent protein kinase 1-like [Gastrolobium bilobum]|uniref:calcium-dependent protein kinase 1-like n=1 Tax=Gastrolobium bilobum TaxID=150636 RepID=UPI002AB0C742|nr:calcium-dependent protein kinase 1-like [Gastrolobium bilobum]
MGNNCVGSRNSKDGVFPSFLSSSFCCWSQPTIEGVSLEYVEISCAPSLVSKRANPNDPDTVHQKPPEVVKFDNKEMKQVQQTTYKESNKPSEEQIKHVEQNTIPPKNSLGIFTPTWFTAATFLRKDDHRKFVAGTNNHQVFLKQHITLNHVEIYCAPSLVSKRPNPNDPETVHQKPLEVVKFDNKEMKQVQQTTDKESNKPSEEQIKHVEHNTIVLEPVRQKEHTRPAEPAKREKFHNVKMQSIAGLQVDSVLQRKTGYLKEYYNLGPELGQGHYGTTFLCWEKATGNKYACKSIPKEKMVTDDDVEDVRREIQIMHHLAGIPNVVSIKGAYEDAVSVHVVMELCEGGELYDRIVGKGYYTERKAAKLARTIVSVVKDCHALGVIHLDLKPENFLFVNGHEDSTLKAIDFGLSVFFKPGDVFKDPVGSPFYIAPEVLGKRYGPEADVWSAGVIIYILLCGTPPFWGGTEREIYWNVLHGDLNFSSDPWLYISESAKDLIRKMLVRDPKQRITVDEVLRHPWFQVDGGAPLDSAALSRLKQFSLMKKLKKTAFTIIAQNLSEEEISGLKEMFKKIDTDNSGQISFEELKVGLKTFGANLRGSEIFDLMQAADVDNSGTIDYGEFIDATLHLNKVDMEDHFVDAFLYFDKDDSGHITQGKLQACEEFGTQDVLSTSLT